jgi:hypothetical protein
MSVSYVLTQNRIRSTWPFGFSNGFRGHCEIAGQKRAQAQPSATDFVELSPQDNERHIVTGSRQHATKITAGRAGSRNPYAHATPEVWQRPVGVNCGTAVRARKSPVDRTSAVELERSARSSTAVTPCPPARTLCVCDDVCALPKCWGSVIHISALLARAVVMHGRRHCNRHAQ